MRRVNVRLRYAPGAYHAGGWNQVLHGRVRWWLWSRLLWQLRCPVQEDLCDD